MDSGLQCFINSEKHQSVSRVHRFTVWTNLTQELFPFSLDFLARDFHSLLDQSTDDVSRVCVIDPAQPETRPADVTVDEEEPASART